MNITCSSHSSTIFLIALTLFVLTVSLYPFGNSDATSYLYGPVFSALN